MSSLKEGGGWGKFFGKKKKWKRGGGGEKKGGWGGDPSKKEKGKTPYRKTKRYWETLRGECDHLSKQNKKSSLLSTI